MGLDFEIKSSDGAEMRVIGIDALISAFIKTGVEIEVMPEMWHEVGEGIARRAREIVPVLTGDLRDSIYAGHSPNKAVVYAGYGLEPYAPVIEFGGGIHDLKAQPFLTPALHESETRVMATVELALADLIHKRF